MSNTAKHLIISLVLTILLRTIYSEVHTMFFVLSNCITWELAQNWGRLRNRLGSIIYDLITDLAGVIAGIVIVYWIARLI